MNDAEKQEGACLRVSSGSAAVLGLRPLRMETPPTTAYLMLGEGCQRDCAFCTQARSSQADQALLSRVNWPALPTDQVVEAIAIAHAQGRIARACFQVTVSPGHLEATEAAVAALSAASRVPICASVLARSLAQVEGLLDAGAQRVTLALDAATPEVYALTKGGSWARAWSLLERAARRFPGRIGTHLIVGLGETEREMIERIAQLLDLQIAVGLFAFTPVEGTALALQAPPDIGRYRRVQAAHWLLAQGLAQAAQMTYNCDGRLSSLGLAAQSLADALADGEAFRTSGCAGCNRPYYNERPGGVMYNYPRPLSPTEAQGEIADLIASLESGADTQRSPASPR